MKTLLIVSHTPSANTRKLTDWVATGANEASVKLELSEPLKTGPRQVLEADGLILGTTENFGYMSGAMKDFFDRIYYPCLEHTEAMPWALFIRAGLDGQGAKTSIERIVTGLKWKAVAEPLVCKGDVEDYLDSCRELGQLMAAGLEADVF